MKITMEQLKQIFANQAVYLGEHGAVLMLDQCNEQDGMNGRSAEDWAYFFAGQDAHEQQAFDDEMNEFHQNAYGE